MKSVYVIDTDLGYDVDDVFALQYALKLGIVPDLIISGDEVDYDKRARLIKSFLLVAGYPSVPVCAGIDHGSRDFVCDSLINRRFKGVDRDFVSKMSKLIASLKARQRLVYICLQGAANLGLILEEIPEAKHKLDIVMMGGSVDYVRPGRPDWVEHNLRIEPEAFRSVLRSGAVTKIVMAHTTHDTEYEVPYDSDLMDTIRGLPGSDWKFIEEHFRLWADYMGPRKGFRSSHMHDPLTVSVASGGLFVDFNHTPLDLNDGNQVIRADRGPIVFWSKPQSKSRAFMNHFEKVILS
jgi:inosine-uridine nucleoside N-ribohydrolase